MSPTPLAQVVAGVLARPAAVLFIDTCILLDVIRAPVRRAARGVEAARALLAVAPGPHLIVQDIVPTEYADNHAAAVADGRNGVVVLTATWEAGFVGLPLPAPSPPTLLSLVDDLTKLSEDMMAASTVLGRDHNAMSWAIDRVAAKKKPSDRAGKVKDCHIVGHAIAFSAQLQGSGFRHPAFSSARTRPTSPTNPRPTSARTSASTSRPPGSGTPRRSPTP